MKNDVVVLNKLQLLSLKQVLDMDVKHGWTNCFGITAKQALVNMGFMDQKEKLTKKKKEEYYKMICEAWDKAEAEETLNDECAHDPEVSPFTDTTKDNE